MQRGGNRGAPHELPRRVTEACADRGAARRDVGAVQQRRERCLAGRLQTDDYRMPLRERRLRCRNRGVRLERNAEPAEKALVRAPERAERGLPPLRQLARIDETTPHAIPEPRGGVVRRRERRRERRNRCLEVASFKPEHTRHLHSHCFHFEAKELHRRHPPLADAVRELAKVREGRTRAPQTEPREKRHVLDVADSGCAAVQHARPWERRLQSDDIAADARSTVQVLCLVALVEDDAPLERVAAAPLHHLLEPRDLFGTLPLRAAARRRRSAERAPSRLRRGNGTRQLGGLLAAPRSPLAAATVPDILLARAAAPRAAARHEQAVCRKEHAGGTTRLSAACAASA